MTASRDTPDGLGLRGLNAVTESTSHSGRGHLTRGWFGRDIT
jgi:hypothetical protein